jgi:hypothetical protein
MESTMNEPTSTSIYLDDVPFRFWPKVDKSGDCWLWTAEIARSGYGRFRLDGRRQYAHRIAYELTNGPIPDGLMIDHLCHNLACVNPDHLRPVTNKQNHENLKGATASSSSGVLGVSWYAITRKWRAGVGHEGRMIHVGYFATVAEAEAAVIAKRNEIFTHNNLDRVGIEPIV